MNSIRPPGAAQFLRCAAHGSLHVTLTLKRLTDAGRSRARAAFLGAVRHAAEIGPRIVNGGLTPLRRQPARAPNTALIEMSDQRAVRSRKAM
jgi:hypothetical protein